MDWEKFISAFVDWYFNSRPKFKKTNDRRKINVNIDNFDIDNNKITLYPNPTNDSISVTLPNDSGIKTIAFYTILGQKVLEKIYG